MLNTMVMCNNVCAVIELHTQSNTKDWTLNIIDCQEHLEQHQIDSITWIVKTHLKHIEETRNHFDDIVIDVLDFHDKDCHYAFDFRLHIIDVHLR